MALKLELNAVRPAAQPEVVQRTPQPGAVEATAPLAGWTPKTAVDDALRTAQVVGGELQGTPKNGAARREALVKLSSAIDVLAKAVAAEPMARTFEGRTRLASAIAAVGGIQAPKELEALARFQMMRATPSPWR